MNAVNSIISTISDAINEYQPIHVESVTKLLSDAYKDDLNFKVRHMIDHRDIWTILYNRAKELNVSSKTISALTLLKLESDFKFLFSDIDGHSVNHVVEYRQKSTADIRRIIKFEGIKSYLTKTIDWSDVAEYDVQYLWSDLERRYITGGEQL